MKNKCAEFDCTEPSIAIINYRPLCERHVHLEKGSIDHNCEHRRRIQAADPLPGRPRLPAQCADCGATVPAVEVHDEIAKPRHYNSGNIEVWDFIQDQDMCYLSGNVVKYISRYRHKGTPLKDLQKARAYLDKLIAEVEKDATNYGG